MNTKLKTYKRELPINTSNNSIYEHINKRLHSKDNIIDVIVDVSEKIPFINIQKVLHKSMKLITEKTLMTEVYVASVKKGLKRYNLDSITTTKIESELYGFILFYLYQKEYYNKRTGGELIDLEYKIHQKQLFHNKEQVQEEVIKGENGQRIKAIEKLPLLEQKKEYLKLIKEFETNQFINNTDAYKRYIKHFKNNIKRLKEEIKDLKGNEKPTAHPLEKIWLPEAKLPIQKFLKIGIENQLWDKDYNLITKRGSIYGNGKMLLSSLTVALIGYSINSNVDYKIIGKVFCANFNIPINLKTKEPFKTFQKGNPKQIIHLKRLFSIR